MGHKTLYSGITRVDFIVCKRNFVAKLILKFCIEWWWMLELSPKRGHRCIYVEILHPGREWVKGVGRKALWKESHVDDMIHIIVNDENFLRRLIFTNVKEQKNADVYSKILKQLQERYLKYSPPSFFPFTVEQMRTEIKWCVSICKKICLTITNASGIKRLQDQKGYGQWFNLLFPLIKSCDCCQPEQAVKPDPLNDSISESGENIYEKCYSSVANSLSTFLFIPRKFHDVITDFVSLFYWYLRQHSNFSNHMPLYVDGWQDPQ